MNVNSNLRDKLNSINLLGVSAEIHLLVGETNFENLSTVQKIEFLIEIENNYRSAKKIERLIKNSCIPTIGADIHNIDYDIDRGINPLEIQLLASCNFIKKTSNLIIYGPTGIGKTHISSAIGLQACLRHFNVKYIRLPELIYELHQSRENGTLKKQLKKYTKYHLIIIDEWLMTNLNLQNSQNIFEFIHILERKTSIIFCSQFSHSEWHKMIEYNVLADSIMDRIRNNSQIINLGINPDAPSMREKYNVNTNKNLL